MKVKVNQAEQDSENAAVHDTIAGKQNTIASCSCSEATLLRQTLTKIVQICTHDTGMNANADLVQIVEIIDHINDELAVPITHNLD